MEVVNTFLIFICLCVQLSFIYKTAFISACQFFHFFPSDTLPPASGIKQDVMLGLVAYQGWFTRTVRNPFVLVQLDLKLLNIELDETEQYINKNTFCPLQLLFILTRMNQHLRIQILFY